MLGKGSFGEGLYFAAEEAIKREEKRRELEEKSAKLTAQKAISETLHTDDDVLAERIRDLGFDGDSARVFDLLPLIHVSWADGKIQKHERALILALLEKRGITRGSEAFILVESLLEERPSPEFTEASLDLLKALLKERGQSGVDIVDLCLDVADASGGILGLGNRVSSEEREAIQHIADALGPDAHAEFERLLHPTK